MKCRKKSAAYCAPSGRKRRAAQAYARNLPVAGEHIAGAGRAYCLWQQHGKLRVLATPIAQPRRRIAPLWGEKAEAAQAYARNLPVAGEHIAGAGAVLPEAKGGALAKDVPEFAIFGRF